MRVLTYKQENIDELAEIIGKISFSGFEAANMISRIGEIIKSGIPGEIMEGGGSVDSKGSNESQSEGSVE